MQGAIFMEQIWVDFWPLGNTEKKIGLIMNNFEDNFLIFSWAKEFNF